MSVKLLPHQEEAVHKLRSGSILCGGVGTGKSLTSLIYFLSIECCSRETRDGRYIPSNRQPLYIITTARKRDTREWDEECNKVGLAEIGIDVTIDSWNNIKKYENERSGFFIFDEQRVVGYGAWVKSFLKITKKHRWILLSATPGDTWMDYAPVFIANGYYRNRTEFLRKHAVYNMYCTFPKIDRWVDISVLEQYRRDITVTMSYTRKTVPHKEVIYCDYNQDIYSKALNDRWDSIKKEPIKDISNLCVFLRTVVNSDKSRLFEVKKLLQKHPKVIIFYNYNFELDELRKLADIRTTAEWNGQKHEPIPNTKEWIYLVQYTAGCEGWNCIATNAMIFYSQNYSYRVMSQAMGRIDRLNTPFTDLYYYTLSSDSSIDKAITSAIKTKRIFNEKNWIKDQEDKCVGIQAHRNRQVN